MVVALAVDVVTKFSMLRIHPIPPAVILFRDVEHSGTSSAPETSSNNSGIRQLKFPVVPRRAGRVRVKTRTRVDSSHIF